MYMYAGLYSIFLHVGVYSFRVVLFKATLFQLNQLAKNVT